MHVLSIALQTDAWMSIALTKYLMRPAGPVLGDTQKQFCASSNTIVDLHQKLACLTCFLAEVVSCKNSLCQMNTVLLHKFLQELAQTHVETRCKFLVQLSWACVMSIRIVHSCMLDVVEPMSTKCKLTTVPLQMYITMPYQVLELWR